MYTSQLGIRRTRISNHCPEAYSLTVLGSAALPAIVQDRFFSRVGNYRPHQLIGMMEKHDGYKQMTHSDIGHREHHQATENHHEHHGVLEHLHDVKGLVRNKVTLPLPWDEFDGVRKLDGRARVQGSADGVGAYFRRGFWLWGDIYAELWASHFNGE
jgi:hypothetical protein